MNLLRTILIGGIGFTALGVNAVETSRWHIAPDNQIIWSVNENIPHEDHIEMSGKAVSVVLRYGVDSEGTFRLNKSMVWPRLRTIPNNTHASLMRRYDWNPLAGVTVNGRSLQRGEKVKELGIKGKLQVKSVVNQGYYGEWEIVREYFPSTELPALVELYQVINKGKNSLAVEIPKDGFMAQTDPSKGVKGTYFIEGKLLQNGYFTLQPGDTLRFSASISAHDSEASSLVLDACAEKVKENR